MSWEVLGTLPPKLYTARFLSLTAHAVQGSPGLAAIVVKAASLLTTDSHNLRLKMELDKR